MLINHLLKKCHSFINHYEWIFIRLSKQSGVYLMPCIINIYSRSCISSTLTVSCNLYTFKAHLHRLQEHVVYSPWFCKDRVIVPFLRPRPQVFPWVGVIIWCIVVQKTFCFFCWRGKMTNMSGSFLMSFLIYRKWNGRRDGKVPCEGEGTVY